MRGLDGPYEREIAAPAASPARIVELVTSLPSSTVEAPRNMSEAMLQRLGEVAAKHNGGVLLHGRLFAQWLHHAYPRECPFPHIQGATSFMAPVDYQIASGVNVKMSEASLRHHSMDQEGASLDGESEEDLLPWHPKEEHVVEPLDGVSAMLLRQAKPAGRSLKLVGVVVSIGVGLLHSRKDSLVGAQAARVALLHSTLLDRFWRAVPSVPALADNGRRVAPNAVHGSCGRRQCNTAIPCWLIAVHRQAGRGVIILASWNLQGKTVDYRIATPPHAV